MYLEIQSLGSLMRGESKWEVEKGRIEVRVES